MTTSQAGNSICAAVLLASQERDFEKQPTVVCCECMCIHLQDTAPQPTCFEPSAFALPFYCVYEWVYVCVCACVCYRWRKCRRWKVLGWPCLLQALLDILWSWVPNEMALLSSPRPLHSLTAWVDSTNRKRSGERESGLDVTSRLCEPPAEFQPPAFMCA